MWVCAGSWAPSLGWLLWMALAKQLDCESLFTDQPVWNCAGQPPNWLACTRGTCCVCCCCCCRSVWRARPSARSIWLVQRATSVSPARGCGRRQSSCSCSHTPRCCCWGSSALRRAAAPRAATGQQQRPTPHARWVWMQQDYAGQRSQPPLSGCILHSQCVAPSALPPLTCPLPPCVCLPR